MSYDDVSVVGQVIPPAQPVMSNPPGRVERLPEPPLVIGQLAAALAKAQAAYPEVKKSKDVTITKRDGGSFRFSYAPLDAIFDAVRKPLADNGLAVTQIIGGSNLTTILMHESGEYLEGVIPIPRSEDIKALGASITYLRRYSLQSMLGIAAEEDTDGPQDGPSQQPAQPKGGRVAATVQTRLRDTERPAAPAGPPVAAPTAPASPVAAPVAPEKPVDPTPPAPEAAAAPVTEPESQTAAPDAPEPVASTPDQTESTDGATTDGPTPDPAIVSESPEQTGLSVDEFKRLSRDKHIFPAQLAAVAGQLFPEEKGQTLSQLSDEQRFQILMAAIVQFG